MTIPEAILITQLAVIAVFSLDIWRMLRKKS